MRQMNAIRHIRKNVFRINQAEFASLAGVTQATVSRWEAEGHVGPSLDELRRIRAAAVTRKLDWNDHWLFAAPAELSAAFGDAA